MKKDNLFCFKKIVFLFSLISIITTQFTYSQCDNTVPTGDAIQYFCKSDNSTIKNLVAIGDEITWYDAPSGGNPYDLDDSLFNGATYYADNVLNDGCSPTRLEVVAVINGNAPTNVNVYVGKCASENPTIADLNATGSNIEWYDAQTNGNFLPSTTSLTDGSTYWVQQTDNGCVSSRLPTTITLIDPTPPDVATSQTFCYPPNPKVQDLQPSGSDIIWYENEDSTIALNSQTLLVDGKTYWAVTNSFPCESTVRVKTKVTLDTAPNAGTDGSLTVCEIDATTTNLFSLLGGTPDITGTWSGPSDLSNDHLGTYNPTTNIEGTYIYTVATTLGTCPESTANVVVNIIEVLPPTTTEANQTFCEINKPTIANLNIIGETISWYDTETSTTPLTSTNLLIDGEDYWASQTEASGCESANRLKINVTITSPLPPATTSVNQIFCKINTPTIANLDITGENIAWYESETSTTPLTSTDLLVDGEDYWATQTETSGCESANRLQINVTITSPVTPNTSSTDQTFCEVENKTIADLEVTGGNIVWYDTETSTTPLTNTDLLVDGDYWAAEKIASGCESVNRLKINVTITKTVAPTTTEANQSFCIVDYYPSTPTIANLNITGTGIVWYDTETSTTPLDVNDALINGEDYWAVQKDASSECESASRLAVTVTVLNPAKPTTSSQSQTFCSAENATIASLDITGENIAWYESETSTTPLTSTDLLVDGEDYWATQTEASGCESANRLQINVTVTTPVKPTTISTDQFFCEIENKTIADLEIDGTGIVWYDTETSTTPLDITEILDNGDYWASQTEGTSCESTDRLAINVTISKPAKPTTSATNQTFCIGDYAPNTPTIADIDVTGTGIVWYDTEASTTPLDSTDVLINGEDYWAAQIDASSECESASRLAVTVTVLNPVKPTTSSQSQTFCSAENATIASIDITGENIIWYDSETSTTPLDINDLIIDGEDYWAAASDATNSCESIDRLVVTSYITDVLPPTISLTTQSFCAADLPKISDLSITGNGIVWYATQFDTTPLDSSDLLIDGEDYWAAQTTTSSTCESSIRATVTAAVFDAGTPLIIITGNEFCKIDEPTLSNLNDNVTAVNGGTITWYDSYPNGTELSLTEFLENDATYYAIETNTNNCISLNPLEVTVTLDACDEYDVIIYDGFSPTGDGINDTFKIGNLKELYPNFTVDFYNRWGNLVFKANASNPEWNGKLNGNDELVPSGVYYYIIHFNKNDRKPIQRRLYLNR